MSQLPNKNYYRKLNSDHTLSFQKEIHTFLEDARDLATFVMKYDYFSLDN